MFQGFQAFRSFSVYQLLRAGARAPSDRVRTVSRVEEIVGTSARLEALMERAKVNGPQRLTFRSCPERAVELLEYALARPRIHNPAAFALTRIRAEQTARAQGGSEEEERAPLTEQELLAALQFARDFGAPAVAIANIERELQELRASSLAV